MQIFDASSRIRLLLCYIAAFYAHFFLPLWSVEPAYLTGSTMDTMLPFMGASAHVIHYMTLGLMPFVSAGLMRSVFFTANPQAETWLIQRGILSLTQRALLYLVSAAMAWVVVRALPEQSLRFGALAPWLELMLSIVSIEWLLHRVQQLGVLSSPVTFFLALNVLGAFVYATIQQTGEQAGVFLSILTCIICFALYQRKFSLHADFLQFGSGRVQQKSCVAQFRYLHAGVMPFVYVSMFGAPLLMSLSSSSQHPAEIIVTSPVLMISMALILWVTSWFLLGKNSSFDDLKHSFQCFSLQFHGHKNTDSFAAAIRVRQALFAGALFWCLIVAQGVFVHIVGPVPLSSFVGGASWLIVASAFFDLKKGYKGEFYDR